MRVITILILSTVMLVGLYIGIYTWLYAQKVKEAQKETSIPTPKKIFTLLQIVITGSFILSVVSLLFLCYELMS